MTRTIAFVACAGFAFPAWAVQIGEPVTIPVSVEVVSSSQDPAIECVWVEDGNDLVEVCG